MTSREDRERVRNLLSWWGVVESKRLKLQRRRSDIMDRLESIMDAKSAPITGLPRGSEISDKTAKAAERYAKELEWHRQELAWIDEDLTALNKMERAITKAVDTLDPVQSAVIELRFKRLPTEKLTPFSKIAAAVNYSQSHVEKYERDAVDALCELIKIEDA